MSERGSGAAEAYQSTDWRGNTPNVAPARPAPARRPVVQRDPFHLRSRPASRALERERAREIVGVARSAVTATFEDIRFGRRVDVAALEPVVAGITASIARDPTALPSVTRLKEVHEYTYLHSVAVCGLMLALAKELALPAEVMHDIGLAGLLHDIGKAAIPTALLDKPGSLDLVEYAEVQQHTVRGRSLLVDAGIASPIVLDVALHHHERIDGGGYPGGMPARDLGVHARMAAVCDVYDAVTSARAYKRSWSPGAALEWMTEVTGHFDPRVLNAFRALVGPFPIGTMVRLESQRLAVVIDDGDATGEPAIVCPFLCAATLRPLAPVPVSTARDRVLCVERPAVWRLDDWDATRVRIVASHPTA